MVVVQCGKCDIAEARAAPALCCRFQGETLEAKAPQLPGVGCRLDRRDDLDAGSRSAEPGDARELVAFRRGDGAEQAPPGEEDGDGRRDALEGPRERIERTEDEPRVGVRAVPRGASSCFGDAGVVRLDSDNGRPRMPAGMLERVTPIARADIEVDGGGPGRKLVVELVETVELAAVYQVHAATSRVSSVRA